MTWNDPTTRSTGDLITAAIWNQDVVDNGQYLHDRAVTRFFGPAINSSTPTAQGEHSTTRVNATSNTYLEFDVPDDFDTLLSLEIALVGESSGTLDIDLDSDYGDPASSETYNYHSETQTGLSQVVSLNNMYWVDVSGVFASLAAGDVCGLKVQYGDTGPYFQVLGLRMVHTRV